MTRVAVVTGGNKGIGLAIVKTLCQKEPTWIVYLTARDVERGEAAVKELEKAGCKPKFHQLDIDSKESAAKLKEFLVETYGGLDVLVNNAGMAYKGNSPAPFAEQAEVTNRTNFFGTLNVCDALFPILRPHARVVHVSSQVSQMAFRKLSKDMQQTFLAATKGSMDNLKKLVQSFVDEAKAGNHEAKGWPSSAYGVSKLGVTVMTYIQQAELDKYDKEDLVVNCCCPGYVQSDMTSQKGRLTTEQGADTPSYLAMLPVNVKEPRGQFLYKRQVMTLGHEGSLFS